MGREVIQKIHENAFANLKPGGKAIHISDPYEPIILPIDVPFEVKKHTDTTLVLKKPRHIK